MAQESLTLGMPAVSQHSAAQHSTEVAPALPHYASRIGLQWRARTWIGVQLKYGADLPSGVGPGEGSPGDCGVMQRWAMLDAVSTTTTALTAERS